MSILILTYRFIFILHLYIKQFFVSLCTSVIVIFYLYVQLFSLWEVTSHWSSDTQWAPWLVPCSRAPEQNRKCWQLQPELRPDGLNFWLYTRCSRSVQIKAPGHSSLLTPNNQLVNEQVSCCLICALKQSIICPYCCYYHLYYFVINIIIIVLLLLLSTSCCVY